MADVHQRIKGEIVATVERPKMNVEEGSLLILTTVYFWFVFLLKIGEIHIILDMYMDKVGIPMLITMSKE